MNEPAGRAPLGRLLDRCRFPAAGTAVSCAVSGGADSLALLALAVEAGCIVTAVHVDHGLREGSAAEAEVVATAAARFGARFESLRVTVPPGPNLEARARDARYAVLPADVLTGHTADDQAETLILALLRGAGWDGLGAMAPDGHPLLGLRRSETAALCAALDLHPLEDPSNLDPSFTRNRVRRELLPLMVDISRRDPVPQLVRTAALLRDGGAVLDALAGELDVTDARSLSVAPEILARTALRRWIRSTWDSPHPPDLATVDRALAVARGEVRSADLERGWRVRRSGQRLALIAPGAGRPAVPGDAGAPAHLG